MVALPTPDRLDFAVVAISAVLLVVGYLLYPTHLVQVSVWLSIITLFICWLGYSLYRLVYDEVEF
jgi:VIT1/CCC1 family predicted Fe2+/Mn2+ transporter